VKRIGDVADARCSTMDTAVFLRVACPASFAGRSFKIGCLRAAAVSSHLSQKACRTSIAGTTQPVRWRKAYQRVIMVVKSICPSFCRLCCAGADGRRGNVGDAVAWQRSTSQRDVTPCVHITGAAGYPKANHAKILLHVEKPDSFALACTLEDRLYDYLV
jgi:hypothetical protein